jgi:hypothetical protein
VNMSSTKVTLLCESDETFHPTKVFVGGEELLSFLKADEKLMANKRAKEGIDDMEILFKLLRAYKVLDKVGTV